MALLSRKFKYIALGSVLAGAVMAGGFELYGGSDPGLPDLPAQPSSLADDFFSLPFCAEVDPNLREASAITLPEGTETSPPPCIPLPDDGAMKPRPLPPAAYVPPLPTLAI